MSQKDPLAMDPNRSTFCCPRNGMDWIKLDHSKEKTKPLVWQLTDALRQAVQKGQLPAGYKLPSSRVLAEQLKLSRNVVILAYEQLAVEGYLQPRSGSGSYVANGALWQERVDEADDKDSEALNQIKRGVAEKPIIHFRAGVPALDLFPRRLWGQLAHEVCRTISAVELGYSAAAGCLSLRQILRKHLSLYRGVRCSIEQIVVTSGAAQAFDILAHMLPSILQDVIVEDPMTKAIRLNFARAGLNVLPIEVDEQGMRTELLPRDKSARAVFVTPSHQFPLGAVLPIQRRIELVRFAQSSNSYIIEDDYDSEFRHHGSPLPALQELAPDRVVYVGTFSKMLFPALRSGYVVLPLPFIDDFCNRKDVHDRQCPIIDQLTLARFIGEGHLQRHILRMKKIYTQRRATLIDSLENAFGKRVRILGDATGMHLIAEFAGWQFTSKDISQLEAQGVRICPVEEYAIVPGRHTSSLIFGYGNLSTDDINSGIEKLAFALNGQT